MASRKTGKEIKYQSTRHAGADQDIGHLRDIADACDSIANRENVEAVGCQNLVQ